MDNETLAMLITTSCIDDSIMSSKTLRSAAILGLATISYLNTQAL